MLFSILIANYNNSRFLATVFKSIYDQSFTNWEIILVDDGSIDDFEEIIQPYLSDNRIKITRNGVNRGCGYTKWACAGYASGELMAFVDPDDALAPGALQIMHDAHLRKPEFSLIYSTHFVCDENLTKQRISEKPRILPENIPYLLLNDGSIHHFASFKKSFYYKTQGLTPERAYDKAVDQDLYYLLEEQGPVYFIPEPLYYYRIHRGSISNWGQEGSAMKAHFSVIEDACQRRIKTLKTSRAPDSKYWQRIYRTRYYKALIMNSYRRRNWMRFLTGLVLFPFIGGMKNIISYLKKIPSQGKTLLRKSFIENYQH